MTAILIPLQVHLRSGSCICTNGGCGPPQTALSGGLDGGRWYLLPGRLCVQYVCHECGPLLGFPTGQDSGPVVCPSPGCVHITGGKDETAASADF